MTSRRSRNLREARKGVAFREFVREGRELQRQFNESPQEVTGPFSVTPQLSSPSWEPPDDGSDLELDTHLLSKLGFRADGEPVAGNKFPMRLSITATQAESSPKVTATVAQCSIEGDGTASYDCNGLKSINKPFVNTSFRNYDLNTGCRSIQHPAEVEMQVAMDALAAARQTFLDGPVVVAMRGCLTSLAEALVLSRSCPVLQVFRIGDALILARSPAAQLGETPVEVAHRGRRFEALCKGAVLPADGSCMSRYFQIIDVAFAGGQLFVVTGIDARDADMPEVMVEVKLMKHPKLCKIMSVCSHLLRAWLQASFSMHEHFLIGLHNEHHVESFLQGGQPGSPYVTLQDLTRLLDQHRMRLRDDRSLWDPSALFGWLARAVGFLKRNTRPGNAYLFHRPRSSSEAQQGVDHFVLEEKPELWVGCPDVFSHALRKHWHAQVVDRIATCLRAPDTPSISGASAVRKEEQLPGKHGSYSRHSMAEIILLDFSRNPQTFRDILQECSELQACRRRQHPSGAHIFVRLEDIDETMDAIDREGWILKRRHVIVAQEFEDMVMEVVKKIPSREQVRLKSRTAATPGPADEGLDAEQASDNVKERFDIELFLQFCVKRTFIHVPCEASIYSGPSSGPQTASTSDANPRILVQPRKM